MQLKLAGPIVCTMAILIFAYILVITIFAFVVYPNPPSKKCTNYFKVTKADSSPTLVERVCQDNGLSRTLEIEKASYIMFDSYCHIDSCLLTEYYPGKTMFVSGIRGSDLIAGKDSLAIFVPRKWLPKTYVIPKDLTRLHDEFDSRKIYVAKKNIQRQTGISLARFESIGDIDSITSNHDVVVIQEMLQDPYIIDGRKINLRIYMLIVIDVDLRVQMHIHGGFVYYTPEAFRVNSLEPKETITTGYIDRSVYEKNPLTVGDLAVQMGPDAYGKMMTNMIAMFKDIKTAYAPLWRRENTPQLVPGTKFCIFGCDVAPSASLNVALMEVNKGPNMQRHDDRDGELKYKVIEGAHEIVGVFEGKHGSEWIAIE